MPQEFDVVCLGGGVAGEAIAVGLQDSGLTLAVVERELVGGECRHEGGATTRHTLLMPFTRNDGGHYEQHTDS